MRSLLLVALAAALGAACQTPADLTPKTGPGTVYPCGIWGTVCLTEGQRSGFCCGEGEVCGSANHHPTNPSSGEDPSCPTGACCDVRGAAQLMGASRDAGPPQPPRPPHEQSLSR